MSSTLMNGPLRADKGSPDSSATDIGYGHLSILVAMSIKSGLFKLGKLCDGCPGLAHPSTKVSSSLTGIMNGGVRHSGVARDDGADAPNWFCWGVEDVAVHEL
ncbi:hypothetical protein V496_00369 [Pseudogymnoascus sp. VKM F-4515 (FW-2607)]|nr:hypothetical protein V496_00369 [Pseudogymnoascus sp. VKM F-4515 (FW-2607)]